MYDVIIIGVGMAGMTAAIYVARAGRKVLVLENKAHGGQIINSYKIENWPGDFGVSGPDLMEKIYNQMKDLGAEIKYEEAISLKEEGEKFLVKTDEAEYNCDAIIIATGTEPRKLDEERTKEVGDRPILYCATCDGALYKDKTVAVIGGGNSAKHEIEYLEKIVAKVYPVHFEDPIPEDVEAVFVAIGREPATSAFKDFVDLDENGYIVADESCKTSRNGVFVAGDCRTKNIRQLVTAAGDGAVAAETAIRYLGE